MFTYHRELTNKAVGDREKCNPKKSQSAHPCKCATVPEKSSIKTIVSILSL